MPIKLPHIVKQNHMHEDVSLTKAGFMNPSDYVKLLNAVDTSLLGQPNGIATLGPDGLLTASQRAGGSGEVGPVTASQVLLHDEYDLYDATNVEDALDEIYRKYSRDGHMHSWSDLYNVPESFTPSYHTHSISEVSNLQNTLNGLADRRHTHQIDDILGLDYELAFKANFQHTHTIADVQWLQSALDSKSSEGHTHQISDIPLLTTQLSQKASVNHSHTMSNISGLEDALLWKASSTHNHEMSTLTNFQYYMDKKANSVHTHNIASVDGLQLALDNVNSSLGSKADNSHVHYYTQISGLQYELDGRPTRPEMTTADTAILNQSKTYTDTKVSALVNASPAALDTLKELAQALGNDANFSTTITTQIGTKANSADLTTHTGNATIHITSTERTTWNAKANASHTHAISEVTGLQAALDAKASTAVATTTTSGLLSATDKAKLDSVTSGANSYVHPTGDGNLHVPATGTTNAGKVLKAGATAGSLSWAIVDYSEIGNRPATMTPSAHTHAISEVTNLQAALDSKAAVAHTHAVSEVTGLQATLDTKSAIGHSHGIADVTNLQTTLNGKAAVAHTHAISEVTGLQGSLDGKAATIHSHVISDVTNLQTTLDSKASSSHSHAIGEVTGLQAALDAKSSTNVVTTTTDGLMIASDKVKLNGIATNANNYVHPTTDGSLHVPATSTTNNGKILKAGATAGSFSWSTIAYSDLIGVPSTFAPSAHTHGISEVTGLQSAIDAKANVAHTHSISDTTGLQAALDGKASTSVVTTTTDGIMLATDKVKLNGIATGANNYIHPTTDGSLHVPATSTTNNGKILRAGSTAGSLSWATLAYTELTAIPTTFAPSAHTHAISEITSLQTTLDGKASSVHTHAVSDVTGLQSLLDAKASLATVTTSTNGLMIAADKTKLDGVATNANNYAHPMGDGNLHVPATSTTNNGKILRAGSTAGSLSWATLAYTDLTAIPTSFTPSAHVHAISEVTNLQTTLNGKAATVHTHAVSDVTGLQSALDGKVSEGSRNLANGFAGLDATGKINVAQLPEAGTTTVDWVNVQNKPTTYTPSAHAHSISEVTGLQTALDAKATMAQVTTSTDGLMIASDKVKLNGIAANANNYVHPTGDGSLHVPATSTTNNGKILKAGATAGSLSWATLAYTDLTSIPTTFAPSAHSHAISEVTGLQSALDSKAASVHTHSISDTTGLQAALDAKASMAQVTTSTDGLMIASDKVKLNGIATGANNYIHPTTDGSLHVPATSTTNNGKLLKAGATAGSFAWATIAYSELTGVPSTFTPSAHVHAISDVTSLQSALDAKASSVHTHNISDTTGLQAALDGKASTSVVTTTTDGLMIASDKVKLNGIATGANNYSHPTGDGNLHVPATSTTNNLKVLKAGATAGSLAWSSVAYSELTGVPSTFAPSAHVHAISDVTGLQSAIDAKAASVHTHTISDTTGLQAALDAKASTAQVTTTVDGLMIAADKVKLNGIATGANNYVHPTGDGSLHVPATSTTNNLKVLKAGSTAGSLAWSSVAYSELTGVPSTFAPSAHVHAISDVTNLQTTLNAKAALSHTHAIADTTGLQAALDDKASLSQAQGYATTAETNAKSYTDTKVSALVDAAPGTLDTLNELAQALGDDPNFATTISNQIATKADSSALSTHTSDTVIHVTQSDRDAWNGKANAIHTHAIADITSLQTTLNGKASTAAVTTSVNGLMIASDKAKLDGIAASANNYVHPTGDGSLHVPATSTTNNLKVLKAGSTAGSLSWANIAYSELTGVPSTFAPTAHTHAISEITSLQTTLDGKASTSHTHSISDTTGLQAALDAKATTAQVTTTVDGLMIASDKVKLNGIATGANNYSHPTGDGNLHVPATSTTNNLKVLKAGSTAGSLSWANIAYSELTGVPTSFTPATHTHTIAQVTSLQSSLDAKADTVHVHAISDTTGLQSALDAKASTAQVTTTTDGLMIAADKAKLNGIAASANNYVHPTGDGNLHVPVTSTTSNGKFLGAGTTAGSIAWDFVNWSEIASKPTTFAPTAHVHAISEVTGLQAAIDAKADSGHTHAIADVSGLQAALDSKTSAGQVTTTTDGLMIAADKVKLNGISTGANKTTNPATNGVIAIDGVNTTVYTHPAGDGNLHVPATSTTNNAKVLKAGSTAGSLSWANVAYSELTGVPSTFAPSTHTHAIADVSGLQTALDAKASTTQVTTTVDGLMIAADKVKLNGISTGANKTLNSGTNGQITIDGVAQTVYTHPAGDGNLHVPATSTTSNGKFLEAGSTAGSLVWNFITWTDVTSKPTTFAPSAHTHAISEITNLQTTLDGKASSSHTHAIADVSGLQAALDSKTSASQVTTTTDGLMIAADKVKLNGISTGANKTTNPATNGVIAIDGVNSTVYTHPAGDGNLHVPATSTTNNLKVLKAGSTAGSLAWANVAYSELTGVPSTFTPAAHTHTIAQVTSLQSSLDAKADSVHAHNVSDVTGLQTELESRPTSTQAQAYATTAESNAKAASVPRNDTRANTIDLNTYTTTGFFALGTTITNGPAGFSYGSMMVTTSATDRVAQVVFSPGQSKLYIRYGTLAPLTWSAWVELATTAAATGSLAGLMSSADFTKLSGIATNANNYVHPAGDGNLHVPATGTTNSGKFLEAGATAGSAAWNFITWTDVTAKPTTFAPSAHSHAIADVSGLQAALDSKTSASQVTTSADGLMIAADKVKLNGISTGANKTTNPATNGVIAIDGVNTTVYTHPAGDGNLHVPATGTTNNGKVLKAGTTAGSGAWANVAYSELTGVPSTFAPSAHVHAIADTTGLQSALDAKAGTAHTHSISEVTNLQTTLDGKALASHTHTIAQVTSLQTTLDGKAATSHTHTVANVTNLQSLLDGKAAAVHTHEIGDVNNLWNVLGEKVSRVQGTMDSPTVLGKMKFDSNTYLSAGGVLDLSNSDIVGVNGMYFNDVTDANEGIGFLKTSGTAGSVAYTDYDILKIVDGAGYLGTTPIFTAKANADNLWAGVLMMKSGESVTPSKKLSDCPGGWILVWSDLDPPSTANNSQWVYTVVPKFAATTPSSQYFAIPTNHSTTATTYTIKTVTITDTTIGGGTNNSASGSLSDDVCLRYVVEF